MKNKLLLLALLLLVQSSRGTVRVSVLETNGLASIRYECTAGEVVRAFALDVSVDRGQILGVTNFFRGPCTATAQGYGIFPASFRDNITVSSATNADWDAGAYSPVAVAADNPTDTLPGLNSSGVTLEFGAVWDPTVPGAVPPASGMLCALQLSQTATVTVAANQSRGGLIAAPSDITLTPQFSGALVGPAIMNTTFVNGLLTVVFQGGELEAAPTVNGPWSGTGNATGSYTENPGPSPAEFYRVHRH